jgi:succinoglycan biosynthesis protein ExoO
MLETKVSVIVPAYNVRGCIDRALDSAFAQEGVSIEVIVIDDCSTDGTADLVAARMETCRGLTIIRMPANKGPAAARNRGILEARGEWVALLDADDWWRPQRLKSLIGCARDYDFVADNIMSFDVANDCEAWPLFPAGENFELHLLDLLVPPPPGESHDFGYLKPVMRRSYLETMCLSYNEDLRSGEDLMFYLEFLAKGGRALFVNEPLYIYAMPVGPISRKASPYSKTHARNDLLVKALSAFRANHQAVLTQTQDAALAEKIGRFAAEAPISEFHHARASRDIVAMIRLILCEKSVQSKIFGRMARRLAIFIMPLFLLVLLNSDYFIR